MAPLHQQWTMAGLISVIPISAIRTSFFSQYACANGPVVLHYCFTTFDFASWLAVIVAISERHKILNLGHCLHQRTDTHYCMGTYNKLWQVVNNTINIHRLMKLVTRHLTNSFQHSLQKQPLSVGLGTSSGCSWGLRMTSALCSSCLYCYFRKALSNLIYFSYLCSVCHLLSK